MHLQVVRLETSDGELRRRLQAREPGVSQDFIVGVAPVMAEDMRGNDIDDIVIDNGPGRSVTQVALDVLTALGWPTTEL